MTYFKDLFGRLCQSRRWVATQFILIPLLILIGIAWTRLPEKHVWQVLLSLLLPLLLAISALELQAGTMRGLANDDGKRVKLVWGALTLLVWVAVVWVCWALLDWCDERFIQWAGYLNSQSPARWRAKFLTYEHLYLWMTCLEWVLRWIVVPAKVIPYAIASAQCGWRLPWRRVLHLLWNWRWWLAVMLAALVAVWLPSHFFTAAPHGSVHAQEARVALKLAASYLLGVGGWILLLAWAGVLFGRQKPLPENDAVTELFARLHASRRWVGAIFAWMLLWTVVHRTLIRIPDDLSWRLWLIVPLTLMLLIAALVLQVVMVRSLLKDEGKRVRLVWGTLAPLLWMVPPVVASALLDSLHITVLQWILDSLVVPSIFIPFVAASTVRGLRLPWKRVLRVIGTWRWWLGVLLAAIEVELALLISSNVFSTSGWVSELSLGVVSLFVMGIWILLLGWLAVLFDRTLPPAKDELAEIPALTGPPKPEKQDSVKLPLPEGE
ncbi:MAG: hypothetical protein ACLQGT_06850 [Terracidiphilus sp.]